MCRLAPSSWRSELFKRRRLMAKWTGRDRSIASCSIPGDIGTVIRSFVVEDVVLIVGESALLRYDPKTRQRLVFYYSTRFSESAVLSCCALGPKKQLLFGFSDGSVIVVDKIPTDPSLGWDQCNWYCLLSAGGPCVVDVKTIDGKPFIAVIGQRRQSETSACASVYNLKTKGRISRQIVPDYSECILEQDGRITLPLHQNIQMMLHDGCEVNKEEIYKPDFDPFKIPNLHAFSNTERTLLVLQVSADELVFFNFYDFMMTARVCVKNVESIIDVYVLSEVVIVLGEACVVVLDGVGGSVIAKRTFKPKPPVKSIIHAKEGLIYIHNGNELAIITIKPQSAPPAPVKSPKTKKQVEKCNQLHIQEGISQITDEKRTEEFLELKRAKMNIEGLTEEEMIQYAQILSLQ